MMKCYEIAMRCHVGFAESSTRSATITGLPLAAAVMPSIYMRRRESDNMCSAPWQSRGSHMYGMLMAVASDLTSHVATRTGTFNLL